MRSFPIGARTLTDESPAYLIAEVGHNHGGSVEQARKLIEEAARAGAHAVKFQKRDNRTLYTRQFFDQPYGGEVSHGPTYGLHREALELSEDAYVELQAVARSHGIDFFATAFDRPSADFLCRLDVPAIKVASALLTDTPFLRYLARTGIPLVVSTGAATMEDIDRAVEVLAGGTSAFCLLHCTAAYPVLEYGELNLRVIPTLRARFPDLLIGYSGHDPGISMPLVAYVLGARVIEKHFTLNRALHGTDHGWSLEPVGLRKLARDLTRAHEAFGNGMKRIYQSEHGAARKMGKALYARADLPAGTRLSSNTLEARSPADGLLPFYLELVRGTRLRCEKPAESLLALDDIDWPE